MPSFPALFRTDVLPSLWDIAMKKTLIQFALLVAVVVGASFVSTRLWAGKPEGGAETGPLILEATMTVGQFARRNELPPQLLKKVFGLQSPQDKQKPVTAFGMDHDEILQKTEGLLALQAEHGSKSWRKIVAKFSLWLAFLAAVVVLMRKGQITARRRKGLLLTAVVLFGVILGSDPSPMGTVKDAIVLFGAKGVIFPPRLIAFGVFLLMVIVANKFICSWGCQLGTLQDLIFRLNRDQDDRKGLFRQFKVPFVLSNGVRIAFFAALTAVAFLWATDLVEHIDPFKVFKPQVLGLAGAAFISTILVLSLFTYRPWCHFFCPFGLAGWVAEKISLFKIQVDYDKCVACGTCAKACPSTVMDAILKRNRVIPDCFACGVCIESCPTQAITFKTGRRDRPPAGKFAKADSQRESERPIDDDRAKKER
jgi:NAD-dependent dihydropyrimidine dehydrogenase PreA subunit